MNENYELKGCVRRLEQRRQSKPLTPRIDKSRDFESFDVEFSPIGQVQNLTTYTRTGAVDGSERHIYDEMGNLISIVAFDGGGVQTTTTEFEYDKEQRRVEWIVRDFSAALLRRGTDQYFGDLLISLATFRPDGLPIALKTFEYAEKRLLKSVSQFYGFDGRLSERWISAYDSAGRLIETFGLKEDGKPLGDGRYMYEYDKEGRKYRVSSFNEGSHDDTPNVVSDFVYKCDEQGNWIERREYRRLRSESHRRETLSTRKLVY